LHNPLGKAKNRTKIGYSGHAFYLPRHIEFIFNKLTMTNVFIINFCRPGKLRTPEEATPVRATARAADCIVVSASSGIRKSPV